MTTTLREQIQAVVLADTGTGGVLGMLGAGASSVYPRLDDPTLTEPAPVGSRPWLLLQVMPVRAIDSALAFAGFRWTVYDEPGNRFWSIDKICARLKHLYPYRRGAVYTDPNGTAVGQQFAFESEDAVDDNWNQLLRRMEWQLWRMIPNT